MHYLKKHGFQKSLCQHKIYLLKIFIYFFERQRVREEEKREANLITYWVIAQMPVRAAPEAGSGNSLWVSKGHAEYWAPPLPSRMRTGRSLELEVQEGLTPSPCHARCRHAKRHLSRHAKLPSSHLFLTHPHTTVSGLVVPLS